ncbi:Gfo/Idh/MocA family oxidoreductase [Catellatospora sp. KI3]|uniref:Gfo/Idh/MocA family protein n=1 Tax=Catellatospora sp. KI3 TaxID=3041620 RepID=UPI0024830926|nr:Gfo/Idh/MocA family oxidoreductase [Catellatospora sp. KI3]MDI1465791.1 Gfo/Idh/MocA family oxidoreductase [Catellatospora sp. KI3]
MTDQSSDRAIRWGILATGGIAARFAQDLAKVPGTVLAAVGSRTASSADTFAQRYGAARAHGSWEALAADPDVDIIYVATPHSHHHETALLCLRAGKPLLVEKAFTLDLATAQDLVSVARERELFLMEAMWTRTLPAILKAKQLLADGAIGEVVSVQASFGIGLDPGPEHRLRDPKLGGGALLDLGVYPVSFAQFLLGAPTQVRAWATLHPEGTDARTGMILGFDSGAVATLYCGVGGDVRMATITGSTGKIDFPWGFHAPDRFVLHRDGAEPQQFDFDPTGLNYEAEEATRCLRAGRLESDLVPLSSTLAVMSTLDAVRAQIGVVYA